MQSIFFATPNWSEFLSICKGIFERRKKHKKEAALGKYSNEIYRTYVQLCEVEIVI